jgi:hypothetical protein
MKLCVVTCHCDMTVTLIATTTFLFRYFRKKKASDCIRACTVGTDVSRRIAFIFVCQTAQDDLSLTVLQPVFFPSDSFSPKSLSQPIAGTEGYCYAVSHTVTHSYSVGLPWTSDRPVAETSTGNTQHQCVFTSIPPATFEPVIPAIEWSKTAQPPWSATFPA